MVEALTRLLQEVRTEAGREGTQADTWEQQCRPSCRD
jgi:hypothetical protein